MNKFRPIFIIAAVVIALAVMRANNAQAQLVHKDTSYPKVMSLKCDWDLSGGSFRADIFKSSNADIMPPYLVNVSTEPKHNPLDAVAYGHVLIVFTKGKYTLLIDRDELNFALVDYSKRNEDYIPGGQCYKTNRQF